ncbi:MAG: prolyl oligopeptidase family serine peptidase [Actinomycetales bacterium]
MTQRDDRSEQQSSGPEAAIPAWEARFRAVRVSFPEWADDAPARCLYVSNLTGTYELYAWDRDTGEVRQATSRANGTSDGALTPDGEQLWWFADTDGDEFGVWRRQPFRGGADEPAVPGLEPSYPAGLALGRDGTVVLGRSTEGMTQIVLVRPSARPEVLYEHPEDAGVGALSHDATLLAVSHSEHGDSRHPALRVYALGSSDRRVVAELWDGPGKGVDALGFAPLDGDSRLLVEHERHGRPAVLIWDVATGEQQELDIDLPGDLVASWYPDGTALLVASSHQARSTLHRYDLATGELTAVETPRGVIDAAAVRPDGTVEYLWSSASQPPVVRSTSGQVVLTPAGPAAPPSVDVEDAWVDGPGGTIHALVSRPAQSSTPYATVFLVHGGPTWLDSDSFDSGAAAWVDAGYAVVRVNYRGSTGYGSAWRDAIEGRVGLTELEDIAAVRDWAVATGLADPQRLILTGGSWGGYLTLLGLGTQPDAWALGIAAVPVADYVAAYEDEMEGLQAFDRSLFGGSPEEVPERYEASSPLTYVDAVRAPVLVLVGENDPRCPVRQVDNYLKALEQRDRPHEVYRFDAGHGSLVVDERIRQVRAELAFAARHVPA